MHNECLAVLFVSGKLLRYAETGAGFPRLGLEQGQPVPVLPSYSGGSAVSAIEEVDADEWLRKAGGIRLWMQILRQQKGFATILLRVSDDEQEDDSEIDDTFERFAQPGPWRDA
jgi:hypothetical protein